MKDQVILITGALAGIGRATALAAASEGYKVVVSGRNSHTGAALETELRALGADAQFIKADVRNESEVQALIEGAIARFGRIDVAVNNAGTEGNPAPIVDQTRGGLRRDLRDECARRAALHEARTARHAAPGVRQHCQHFVDHGQPWRRQRFALRRKQTCRRRPDQIRRAGGRSFRRPRQRGRARTGRDRDARPLHRLTGPQGRFACLRSRSAGRAGPKNSRTRSCSSPPTKPPSSRARSSASTAAGPPA